MCTNLKIKLMQKVPFKSDDKCQTPTHSRREEFRGETRNFDFSGWTNYLFPFNSFSLSSPENKDV